MVKLSSRPVNAKVSSPSVGCSSRGFSVFPSREGCHPQPGPRTGVATTVPGLSGGGGKRGNPLNSQDRFSQTGICGAELGYRGGGRVCQAVPGPFQAVQFVTGGPVFRKNGDIPRHFPGGFRFQW